MGQIAIVVGMLLCAAAGFIAGDWRALRHAVEGYEAVAAGHSRSLRTAVAVERELGAREVQRVARQHQVRARVADHPHLAAVPLPPELVRLLDDQTAATRRDRGILPDPRLPRSGVRGAPRD